jgi:dipeptide/tripeptide permease
LDTGFGRRNRLTEIFLLFILGIVFWTLFFFTTPKIKSFISLYESHKTFTHTAIVVLTTIAGAVLVYNLVFVYLVLASIVGGLWGLVLTKRTLIV